MKIFSRALLAIVLLATTQFAAAGIIAKYAVTDAVNTHGLWTGNVLYNGDQGFNLENDVFLTQFDDGTATLQGTASDSGVIWNIDLLLSTYSTTPDGSTKNGGGSPVADWEFYFDVAGTISNNFGDVVNVSRVGPAFQMGTGANDKTGDYGASVWLDVGQPGNHWDINMDLAAVAVPGPASLARFGLGLLALGVSRRRMSAA